MSISTCVRSCGCRTYSYWMVMMRKSTSVWLRSAQIRVEALLPFLPHISGLGIEISSAAAAEQLRGSLGEFHGRLERIWVEYSVEIDECINSIGESCKEVYLASTGSSYITVELGTKVEKVVLAGKLSSKTLRCFTALPSNQLIILDLSHCRLPHRMKVSVDDILERHHGSLSYMAFKYFPLPLSRLAGVGARYPRLVCFPKLLRGLDVMQVVLTDLSPRMTYSAPTGSREDYFSRFDHLPLIGWSEFGVFASTLAIFDFCELEATWASLAGEIKGLWAAAAKSVEQLYGDYRKYVPASKLPPASFDLELSSDSGSAEVDDDNSRLSGNRVKSLDGCLDGLAHLKHLDLSYNRLTSLEDAGSSLGNLMALERLELQGNSISQLLGLQQCWRPPPPSSPLNASDSMPPGVTYLDLRDNRIEDSTQLLYISGMTIKQLLMRGSREHRNTICEDANYRLMVLQTLPDIEVLDGRIVTEDERREARSKALVILRCTRKDERVKLPADRTGSTLAQHSTRRSASHLRNPWVDTSRSTGSREKAASEPLGGGRSSLRRSQQVEAVESLSTQNDSAEANRRIQGDEHRECERQVRQLRAMVATMQEHYEAMLREASARLDGTRDQLEAIEEERRRLEASVKHGEKAKLKHEAALAKDLKLLEADMEKRNRRLKTLEENLTKSEQEGQEAHKVVEELQREKEELLTAKEDLITKCSNMEEKIKDLEESMLKMRELELEVSRLKAHKAEEPVAAPVKPSREDVSAEVEAAKREAIAVVEEKASRLEGEVADLKRELQERREQIRCQRQAYVALEEQFRLKAERDESRVTELTAQLGSERKMSKLS
ncbi:paramyosin, putative [Perkinsus marinus ATCC 50983]|uniref:Paramyosin, putative n=1 Tax=Perkinsus marinus (strain ATCC 50983 / TXsc) TaxID=423536 RepID=C5LDC8_PERM5|nr:paramyosin, putative [Perkinsus marinus ATCC 50983]EER05260.1 paramyosin, putative [Perkinsus marinus ATCC 50983]|eukprot:XP_002773444.1 paramyosin, putative [Perkinsus marinus ATCC 50983]